MVAYSVREASEGSSSIKRSPLWRLNTVKRFSQENDRKLEISPTLDYACF